MIAGKAATLVARYLAGVGLGSALVFWLTLGLPDAALNLGGGMASQEAIDQLRIEHNLVGSPWCRFVTFIGQLTAGDARSFYSNQPLMGAALAKLAVSATLLLATLSAIVILTALFLVVFYILRSLVSAKALLVATGGTVPLFVSALLVLNLSSSIGLPLYAAGAISLAFYPSVMLAAMSHEKWLSLRSKPHVLLAVHYRVPLTSMAYRYLQDYRPVWAILVNAIAFFVSAGLAIVEYVLGLPGFGRWTLEAISRLDLPVIFFSGVLTTATVGLLHLFQDFITDDTGA